MTKKYSERETLTKAQIKKAAMEFLEKNEYFGLNPEHLGMGSLLGEIINRSQDKFTVVREITASILKLEQECETIAKRIEAQRIKTEKEKIEANQQLKQEKHLGVVSFGLEFKNPSMTIGEFLKEVTDRYSAAGLLDTPLRVKPADCSATGAIAKLLKDTDKITLSVEEGTASEYKELIQDTNEAYMEEAIMDKILNDPSLPECVKNAIVNGAAEVVMVPAGAFHPGMFATGMNPTGKSHPELAGILSKVLRGI